MHILGAWAFPRKEWGMHKMAWLAPLFISSYIEREHHIQAWLEKVEGGNRPAAVKMVMEL